MAIKDLVRRKAINQAIRLSPFLGRHSGNFFSHRLRNPIFIIGSARSGTTLLAGLLDTHRDVANWSEANNIWDPDWYPWQPSNQGIGPMEYDPEAFTARWWRRAESRQEEIRAIFGTYQWLRNKSYFANKTPFNTFRIPYLLNMFPGARLIHLVRDGRAVVYSYANKLMEGNKLREWPEPHRSRLAGSFEELATWLASFWKKGLEEVARQDQLLDLTKSGKLFEVTYEELCSDPFLTMKNICRFLELDPARFDSLIRQEQLKNQNHKWKQKLNPDLVARLTHFMEPMLTQKGYLVE